LVGFLALRLAREADWRAREKASVSAVRRPRVAPPYRAPAPVALGSPPREDLDRGGHKQAKKGSTVPTEPDLAIPLRLDAHAPRAARWYVARVDRPSPDLRDAVML